MEQVTVPTSETCSINFWVPLLVERMCPVMLVGTAGCGKTQLINGMTSMLDPTVRLSQTINMNFYTTRCEDRRRDNEKKNGEEEQRRGNDLILRVSMLYSVFVVCCCVVLRSH